MFVCVCVCSNHVPFPSYNMAVGKSVEDSSKHKDVCLQSIEANAPIMPSGEEVNMNLFQGTAIVILIIDKEGNLRERITDIPVKSCPLKQSQTCSCCQCPCHISSQAALETFRIKTRPTETNKRHS